MNLMQFKIAVIGNKIYGDYYNTMGIDK